MATGSVFSQTLQAVTNTKLEELAKQRHAFTSEYEELLLRVECEDDPLEQLMRLADGTKSCLGINVDSSKNNGVISYVSVSGPRNIRLETDLKNLDRFLEQAKFDPSISHEVIKSWQETLLQYLSVQSAKYEFADLYGKLVTEWLSSDKASSVSHTGYRLNIDQPTQSRIITLGGW